MKNKKLYQWVSVFMIVLCAAGMCMVGVRIFAKKVLIGKLGIENYVTCLLADYNWGDRQERVIPVEEETKSDRMLALIELLEHTPKREEQNEEGKAPGFIKRFEMKIEEQEADIEKYCNSKFPLYTELKQVSLSYDAALRWNSTFARTEGASYMLPDGYSYEAVEEKDMTEAAETLVREKEIAEAAGAGFLYVQFPYRVDEENSQVPWGVSAYENKNTDALLAKLGEAGMDTLDLRKALPERGWSYEGGFYLTDGHWTTRSGFLSAGIVAEHLNAKYGFSYDSFYFDEANYDVHSYSLNNPFVKEEVELFLPAFDTDLHTVDAYRKQEITGPFEESCMDLTKADTEEYSTALTAYSASRVRNSYLFEYINRKKTNNNTRVLVCSNSFSWHLIPYLALDTAYVDYVYAVTPEQLAYYVEQLKPEMVIVLDRQE